MLRSSSQQTNSMHRPGVSPARLSPSPRASSRPNDDTAILSQNDALRSRVTKLEKLKDTSEVLIRASLEHHFELVRLRDSQALTQMMESVEQAVRDLQALGLAIVEGMGEVRKTMADRHSSGDTDTSLILVSEYPAWILDEDISGYNTAEGNDKGVKRQQILNAKLEAAVRGSNALVAELLGDLFEVLAEVTMSESPAPSLDLVDEEAYARAKLRAMEEENMNQLQQFAVASQSACYDHDIAAEQLLALQASLSMLKEAALAIEESHEQDKEAAHDDLSEAVTELYNSKQRLEEALLDREALENELELAREELKSQQFANAELVLQLAEADAVLEESTDKLRAEESSHEETRQQLNLELSRALEISEEATQIHAAANSDRTERRAIEEALDGALGRIEGLQADNTALQEENTNLMRMAEQLAESRKGCENQLSEALASASASEITLSELSTALAGAMDEITALNSIIVAYKSDIGNKDQAMSDTQRKLAEEAALNVALLDDKTGLNSQLQKLQEMHDDVATSLESDLQTTKGQVADLSLALEKAIQEIELLREEADQAQETSETLQLLQKAQAQHEQFAEQHKTLSEQLTDAQDKLSSQENALHGLQIEADTLKERLQMAEEQSRHCQEELRVLREERAAAIQAAEEAKSQFEAKGTSLAEQESTSAMCIADLRAQNDHLKGQITTLEEQMAGDAEVTAKSEARLQSVRAELHSHYAITNQECDRLRSELAVAHDQLAGVKTESESAIANSGDTASELQKVIDGLHSDLATAQSHAQVAQQSLAESEAACLSLSEQLAGATSRCGELEQQVDTVNAELRSLRHVGTEDEAKQLAGETRLAELQAELETAHETIANQTEELKKTANELSDIRAAIQSADAVNQQHQDQLTASAAASADQQKLIDALRSELSAAQSDSQATKQAHVELEASCRSLSDQLESARQQTLAAESAADQLQKQLETARERIASLTDELEKHTDALSKERATIANSGDELQKVIDGLHSDLASAQSHAQVAQQALAESEAACLSLSEQLAGATSRCSELEKQIKHVGTEDEAKQLAGETRLAELQAELETAHETIGKLTEELKKTANELSDIRAAIQSADAVNQQHQDQLTASAAASADQQKLIDALRSELSAAQSERQALARQASEYRGEVTRLAAEAKDSEATAASLRTQLDALRDTHADLEAKMRSAQSAAEQGRAEMRGAREDLEDARGRLQDCEHEVSRLQKQLESSRALVDKLRAAGDDDADRLRALEEQVVEFDQIRRRLSEEEGKRRSMEAALGEARSKLEECAVLHASLERAAAASAATIRSLQSENGELRSNQAEMSKLDTNNEELTSTALNAECDSLRQQLRTSHAQLAKLRADAVIMSSSLTAEEARHAETTHDLVLANSQAGAAKAACERAKGEALQYLTKIRDVESELDMGRIEIGRLAGENEALRTQLKDAKAHAAEVDIKATALARAKEEQTTLLSTLKALVSSKDQTITQAQDACDELATQLGHVNEALSSSLKALEEAQKTEADTIRTKDQSASEAQAMKEENARQVARVKALEEELTAMAEDLRSLDESVNDANNAKTRLAARVAELEMEATESKQLLSTTEQQLEDERRSSVALQARSREATVFESTRDDLLNEEAVLRRDIGRLYQQTFTDTLLEFTKASGMSATAASKRHVEVADLLNDTLSLVRGSPALSQRMQNAVKMLRGVGGGSRDSTSREPAFDHRFRNIAWLVATRGGLVLALGDFHKRLYDQEYIPAAKTRLAMMEILRDYLSPVEKLHIGLPHEVAHIDPIAREANERELMRILVHSSVSRSHPRDPNQSMSLSPIRRGNQSHAHSPRNVGSEPASLVGTMNADNTSSHNATFDSSFKGPMPDPRLWRPAGGVADAEDDNIYAPPRYADRLSNSSFTSPRDDSK